MKYWYVAFVVVLGWFILIMVNNSAVSKYKLTAYDSNGKVLGTQIVHRQAMAPPESLPVTKSYTPLKPIGFLD